MTLWEILERRRPFEGLTQHAVQAQWMSDPYAARLPPVRLPDQLDRAGKRILRGLSGGCRPRSGRAALAFSGRAACCCPEARRQGLCAGEGSHASSEGGEKVSFSGGPPVTCP